MIERDKLPAKATENVISRAEQSESLESRGLEAVKNRES